jgi:MFS family permease
MASPRLPRNVVLLGWASFLNDVASEMLFPLLPAFLLQVLKGTKEQLGWIDGLAETTSSLLKLWAGSASDRLGRRKAFVVVGYLLAGVARPLIALSTAPWHLLTLRALDRVGKGIRTAPRDALVAQSATPDARGRAFGFQRAMDHLGAALGPLVAFAFLAAFPNQWRWLFALSAIPAMLTFVLLGWGLREPSPAWNAAPASAAVAPMPGPRLALRLPDAHFRRYLAALFVFTMGNSSDSFLLVRAGELGIATAWLPVLWASFHAVKSAGSHIAGPWIDRLAPRPVLAAGWLIYAVAYLAFAWATTPAQVWMLFFLYAVYYALAEPAEKALVAQIAPPHEHGLAYGWFHLAVGLGALPASVLFGILYQRRGALAAFGTSASLACIALAILASLPPSRPASAASQPAAR